MFKSQNLLVISALIFSVGNWVACKKENAPGGQVPGSAAPSGGSGKPATPPAMPPTNVSVKVLRLEFFSAPLSVTGTLLANQEVELRAEMAGRVEHITFAEGKPVKMGQVLVQIDNAELRANLQKSQARLKLAASQEVRVKQQLDAGAASTKEYEQVSAERSQAEADVALLKAQLAKTQIIAPFSGVAGLLPIYPGTFVQPGTRVTTLQDLSRIKLEFSVPEQEAWRIHQGIKVQFLATGRTDSMEADIYAVEPRLDATTRSLTVRAYAKSSHDLIPGGFAEVILTGGGVDSALVVPPAAITMAGAGALVFVVQQGKAMPHPVRLGGRTPDAVQILSGAKLGDTVITSGFMALKPGSPVAIRSVN